MASHSAARSRSATSAHGAQPAPKRRRVAGSPAATPRPAQLGDVPRSLTRPALEKDSVDRATTRAETRAAMALSDVLAHHAKGGDGPPGQWLQQLQSLVDGAAPDEVKALRRLLFEARAPQSARAATPTWNWCLAGARGATRTAT